MGWVCTFLSDGITYLTRSQRIEIHDVMALLQAAASTWRVEGSS
jgi:hypothetical protein